MPQDAVRWSLTSPSFVLQRPLNHVEDLAYPGTRFTQHEVHGQTLTLHVYEDVEILWYNYGVYVLDAEGRPIPELCYLFGEAPAVETLRSAEPRMLSGVSASLSHWVPANYCHILAEHLPLLQGLEEAGSLATVDHLLCDAWAERFVRDALRLYTSRADIVGLKTIDHVRCKTLLAFEPLQHPAHWGHAVMLRFFERVREAARPAPPHRRLLVTRPVGRRGFANQAELAAALPDFETIDIEKPMTLYEQARLFAEAEIVVCGHGAALTNLVFMRSGSGVVEIFNSGYGMASFWILAEACGVNYCATIDARGLMLHFEDKNENMTADIAEVINCVKLLEDYRR